MPGLCFANELISRDEALHTEFAVLMYNYLSEKPEPETVYSIIREGVLNGKTKFITESLPCSLIGRITKNDNNI